MSECLENRLIVIDDNRSIHDDIRKSLAVRGASKLDAAAALLFGEADREPERPVFDICSAYQGQEGWKAICEAQAAGRPFQTAFVDVRMPPGWDGIETTERIFASDPEIQVVICTAYSDHSISDILKRFGRSDRLLILRKPFDIGEVTLMAVALGEKWRLSRAANERIRAQDRTIVDMTGLLDAVEAMQQELCEANDGLKRQSAHLSDELQESTEAIAETRQIAVLALAQLAESRDPETGAHLKRMQKFAQIIAEELSERGPYRGEVDEVFLQDFFRSTPLHDIGKVGIPDHILLKPGRLTSEEFEVMKRHATIGADALRSVAAAPHGDFLRMASDVARHHHENFDGSGYPDGLRGAQIPLAARIAAVADVFDAMTSARVYKAPLDAEETRRFIEQASGVKFDPVVVEVFLRRFDEILAAKEEIDAEEADSLQETPAEARIPCGAV